MVIYYLANTQLNLTGPENVTVQIYANDGAVITSDQGHTFNAPGTLLFTSPAIKVAPGDQCARLTFGAGLAVPQKITFTLKFQGGNFDVGPFDPGFNTEIPGGRFWGGIPFANVQGATGVAFRQVFTSSGPSGFIAQERPATFPNTVPFAFGAQIWSGNTALITTPYDLGTTLVGTGGFVGISDPALNPSGTSNIGNLMTFNGPSRVLTQVDFGYYADTTMSTGSPTFRLRLLKQNATTGWASGGGTPDETQILWDSGPQPIPLGQGGGGTGALQNVTLPVPSVTVPDSCYWDMSCVGISGGTDDLVGPGLMWGPVPGATPNFVALKIAGAWGQYVFPPSGATGTFVYDTIADLGPIKFTAAASTTTETLAPTAFSVGTSKLQSGTLASLAADDNDPLVVCKFLVPNFNDIIKVSFDFQTTKANITAIDLVTKAKMVQGGVFKVRPFLHNYSTNVDDVIAADTAITAIYNTFTFPASGTLNNYKDATKKMNAKILVRQLGPSVAVIPCVSYEYVNLKVTG